MGGVWAPYLSSGVYIIHSMGFFTLSFSCNHTHCMGLGTDSCLCIYLIVISFNYIIWAHYVRPFGAAVGTLVSFGFRARALSGDS